MIFNNKKFSDELFNKYKFILTSIFLHKLYEELSKKEEENAEKIINDLKELLSIDSYINDIMNRNEVKDTEIKWAYENIINLPFNDILYLPEINENVIECLFIHTISDEKSICGPILNKEYGRLPPTKFYNNFSKTYLYYLTNICSDIFNEIKLNEESDINKIKKILENKPECQEYLIFYNFFCLEFHKYGLKYDDYNYLFEKNWIENKEFIKKFPSFFLWLNQNYNYYDEYLKKNLKYVKKKNLQCLFFFYF